MGREDESTWRQSGEVPDRRLAVSARAGMTTPGLTILWHPEVRRIGERAALIELASGRQVLLSRREPEFSPPGEALPKSLAIPHLSRNPLRLEPAPDGGVRLNGDDSPISVVADGEIVSGSRSFSASEVVTAGEAEVAGPWRVEPIPGAGFGVVRAGEGAGRGFRPVAVFRRRSVALLAASVLPGTGRDRGFLLQTEEDPAGGYAVQNGPKVAGHLALFDERLIEALHVVESLVRSPEALAFLLEAAGSLALERAGTILEGRMS